MLLPQKSPAAHWRCFVDLMMAPVSPKNLRLSAILIGIYQLLVAHLLLFLVLLGLAHAEQMKNMLAMDIEDQKDNGFYDMSPFRNQLRLRTASQLVSVTEMLLYILTAVASVYLLSTIALFAGIFKNRSEFVLPWLVVEFIFIISAAVLVFWLQNEKFVDIIGGKVYYCDYDMLHGTALRLLDVVHYTLFLSEATHHEQVERNCNSRNTLSATGIDTLPLPTREHVSRQQWIQAHPLRVAGWQLLK
ncbi:PREDICTED: uncharacterized protein LOC108367521 isoform X1 [Rhagoletis zephyria]|uniref:uncharacterized protein LOC108367521 isoform X1 n=1 Tax=Rhagoletis zephyria TaxID=28612 RepID=UPI0008115F8E|nr:PREDICTED: uncharacterized protein LOC108367521 isoform X1 [Rhagoletis zephyria]